jgi:hypothetical protein
MHTESNRHLLKKGVEIHNEPVKVYSTSFYCREIQIRAIMRKPHSVSII